MLPSEPRIGDRASACVVARRLGGKASNSKIAEVRASVKGADLLAITFIETLRSGRSPGLQLARLDEGRVGMTAARRFEIWLEFMRSVAPPSGAGAAKSVNQL